jgi:hypothetical protein
MNQRTDWADAVAVELQATMLNPRGLTFSEQRTIIAVSLRDARAKGYAEGLTATYSARTFNAAGEPVRVPTLMEIARERTPADDARLHDLAARLGKQVRSPAEHRARKTDEQYDADRERIRNGCGQL